MKISGVDIRPGNILEYEGGIWKVAKIQHTQPGKGGAFMQVEMKNLIDGRKTNVRFRSADTVERVRLDTKDFQYLYADGENFVFMDLGNYDQITLTTPQVGDAANFMLENQNVTIALHNGNPLYVELPASVVLEITYTEPGLQGDRSSAGTKPATLETGYEIQVPLFLEANTKVKVDTRDGSYLGRVND